MKEWIVAQNEVTKMFLVAEKELIRCKDCKYYRTDIERVISGIPIIIAHNGCSRWANTETMVDPKGYCYLAEKK